MSPDTHISYPSSPVHSRHPAMTQAIPKTCLPSVDVIQHDSRICLAINLCGGALQSSSKDGLLHVGCKQSSSHASPGVQGAGHGAVARSVKSPSCRELILEHSENGIITYQILRRVATAVATPAQHTALHTLAQSENPNPGDVRYPNPSSSALVVAVERDPVSSAA